MSKLDPTFYQRFVEFSKPAEDQKDIRNSNQDAINRANKYGWKIVEKVTNPPDISTIRAAVKNAAIQMLGIKENVDLAVDILMGQLGMETGFKSLHNNNVGNLMAAGSPNQYWKGDVIILLAHEYDKQKKKYYLNSLFRAYDSLNNGVCDWASLLKRKFPAAVERAADGDLEGFVTELKNNRYFTAPVESYMAGVKTWSKKSKTMPTNDSVKKNNITPTNEHKPEDNRFRDLVQSVKSKYMTNGDSMDLTQYTMPQPKVSGPVDSAPTAAVNNMLDNLLDQIRASEKNHSKLYKILLPENSLVIKIFANDKVDAIEFGRILCSALDEELLARSYTHTNNDEVEIECNIHGPQQLCYDTVSQLAKSVAEAFKYATTKIGGIDINTQVVINKKSSYSEITLKSALSNYRKFMLKFA